MIKMNWLRKIFKPNDWYLVHSLQSEFIEYYTFGKQRVPNSEKEITGHFNIYFSKSRKKHKLKIEGVNEYYAKQCSTYSEALLKLAELNNKLNEC